MLNSEILKRVHHDSRLPHELKQWEMNQRQNAYGIRFRLWAKRMKEVFPERYKLYFKKK